MLIGPQRYIFLLAFLFLENPFVAMVCKKLSKCECLIGLPSDPPLNLTCSFLFFV